MWDGKSRRVTLWAYTTFTQAVTCELGKCVGSLSRELGFTTLEQRSWEACMHFTPPPLHPTCFRSVCLVPSLPCLCVGYLTLRYARNSTSLFSFLGSWDACIPVLHPHSPPSLPLELCSYKLWLLLTGRTTEKNNNMSAKLRKSKLNKDSLLTVMDLQQTLWVNILSNSSVFSQISLANLWVSFIVALINTWVKWLCNVKRVSQRHTHRESSPNSSAAASDFQLSVLVLLLATSLFGSFFLINSVSRQQAAVLSKEKEL